MNINFELYRIFYTVANNQNITKASKELNISQPAISKSIKNLENQLGGNLFIRTKRGVILTDEGKQFYKDIKQAMEYINNAEKKFTNLINLECGTIKIGSSTTLTKEYLLPYLEKFNLQYQKIDIQITTGSTQELISKLKKGLIDLVILNVNNTIENSDILIKKWKKTKDCFIVNNKYKTIINQKLSLNDLNNYPLILQTKESNTRKFLDNILLKNNIVLKPKMELTSYTLVIELTKIGLGIGYIPEEFVQKELKNKELFKLNIKETIPTRYIGIALSKNHEPNFSTKKLIEIMQENI